MKHLVISIALICSIGQAFAHSSSHQGQGKEGCHKHDNEKVVHCH
ncbi:hypothetical protein [Acinetobacter sp. NCu2D-2]|nr:hypothetical protein [Acinetobacter sp. NCu2D-2]